MADLDGPYDVPCGDGGDDAAAADTTDQEAATNDADLELPPLPPPLKTRNLEFCCGATTILTCVAVAAGVAVAVIFAPSSNLSTTAKIVCAVLVGVECLVAVISLLVIGFGDPGIVKRTPATINPIPKEVAERLRAVADTAAVAYLLEEGDVEFDSSDPRAEPCGIFVVTGTYVEEQLQLTLERCDSLTRLTQYQRLTEE